MGTHKPVLVVVGTTGVGKSQLGVELAKAVDGEVINCDSMQVYNGLDIATNKITEKEKAGVRHHLMDFVDPAHEYSVTDFERDALKTIDQIHSRNRIPILVGGTNYYIQSLLWKQQIIAAASDCEPAMAENRQVIEEDIAHPSIANSPLATQIAECLRGDNNALTESSDSPTIDVRMFEILQKVDPAMAQRWHPRDLRKVRRSLQIFYTSGKRHSEWLAEQKETEEQEGNQLRFPTCVFWLYAEPNALYPRLDARVDDMVNAGLLQELYQMRHKVLAGQVLGTRPGGDTMITPDYTRGILQTIGFKEFHAYLASGAESEAAEGLLNESLEVMKRATRQYAKRQVTWIKNKLAHKCISAAPMFDDKPMRFFLLDATNLNGWAETVKEPAVDIAQKFLAAQYEALPDPHTLSETATRMLPCLTGRSAEEWKKYECELCVDRQTGQKRVFNGKLEWDVHLRSRGHKKTVQYMHTSIKRGKD
ncbi:hypothetical protein HDU85_003253 [Gaertneriomyces sp. JEL0708]|nr:hypothetical protein HDU85_003253 [Gaertneriomyces sp. JEL0708]